MEPAATGQNVSAKRVIAGLAILTGNLAEGRDYIDLFVPLVGQCIWSGKPSVVSVTALQSQLKDTFGMQIPQNALKLILNRATKRDYVRRQEGAYVPNLEVLAGLNFTTRYKDVVRQQNAAIKKFVKFSSDRFAIRLTEVEAEDALLAYVQKHDIEILECLLNVEAPAPVQPQYTKKIDFVVNSFIVESHDSDPEGFKYIDTMVKGHFLSHTLFFPDLGQIRRRFRRTTVYFDTALLLRVSGYEGAARQESCKELVALLYRQGAALKCFRHTRDELYNVLYACMSAISRGDIEYATPTFTYLRSAGYGASEIELELAILDSKIRNLGIEIVDKPEYLHRYQIDEERLDKALKDKRVYWHERPKQRKHDLDCLSAIYRLRKGRESSYVEDSMAVFVTANSALCKVGAEFFVTEDYIDRSSIPMAITDYALTSLLWLKSPMLAPDFPTKFVIAECYAAVEPSERLWQRYTESASRLKEEKKISANEYYLLRYSQLAHKELMGLTMGDENMITEGTVQDILEAVKMEIRKEDLAQLEEERRMHEERRKEDLARLEEERRLREERERKLKYEHTANRRKWESLNQNIEQKSRRIARCVSTSTLVVVMLLVSFGALFSSIRWWGNWWNYTLLAAYIVFLSLSIANLWNGVTIRDWLSRLESCLATRIQNMLKRWFLPQT